MQPPGKGEKKKALRKTSDGKLQFSQLMRKRRMNLDETCSHKTHFCKSALVEKFTYCQQKGQTGRTLSWLQKLDQAMDETQHQMDPPEEHKRREV